MAQVKKTSDVSFLAFAKENSVSHILLKNFTNSKSGEDFQKIQLATRDGKWIFLNVGPSLQGLQSEKDLGPILKDLQVMELPVKSALKKERKSKGLQQETFILYKKGTIDRGMSIEDLMAMCEE